MNHHFFFITAAVATISIVMIGSITIIDVIADRDDHQKKGNNGGCWKLQKELDLGGTKEDCHDTFTGKDHNDPDPLP